MAEIILVDLRGHPRQNLKFPPKANKKEMCEGMERYPSTDPRRILNKLRCLSITKVYASASPPSICALKMLTSILEREIIKYEVSVVANHDKILPEEYKVLVNLSDKKYSNGLYFGHEEVDTLDRVVTEMDVCVNSSYATILIYEMAQSLNIVDNTILWPLIVVLDFNRSFCLKKFDSLYVKKDDEDEERTEYAGCCDKCDGLYREVVFCARKLNSNERLECIFLKHDIDLLFVNSSTLFSTVGNDLNFILEKKLFFSGKSVIDRDFKIKEFFAHLGVACAETFEKFVNIDESTRKRLERCLRSSSMFYKKTGYNGLISSIEHYFLIYCFLLDSPVHSLLDLKPNHVTSLERPAELYFSLTEILKKSYHKIRSTGKTRYLILNEEVSYKNRALFLTLLLTFFKVVFNRQKRSFKLMIIHESRIDHSIIVSCKDHAVKYLQGIKYWHLDTFGTSFGLESSSLRTFYRKLLRK